MTQDQHHELSMLIHKMKDAPVLVIGDIMLDRFVYGRVERISPESPVPVLSITRENMMLGGAGNALANLAGLKADAQILSVIGDDKDGAQIKNLLSGLGVEPSNLLIDPAHPTIVKTRFLAGHQQLLRTDFEKKSTFSKTLTEEILQKAEELIKNVRALILSDYGKGLLNRDVITRLIEIARSHNVPVIADPKGQDYHIYKGVNAITPNKKELCEATKGFPVDSDEEVITAAHHLIKECGIGAVVATRSKDGMSIIQKDQAPKHLRSSDIEVFDVSGAGDSVIATIAATIAAGGDLVQAGALANLAGSIVVTKVGTAPIRAKELFEALHSDAGDITMGVNGRHAVRVESGAHQAPLLEWDEAAETLKRWRARGLKIGFTNGCFDIVHQGHTSYLNETRAHCDRLVLALNNDASVRVLKGPERPIHNEVSRAAVLGALSSVDLVVLFGAQEKGQDNTACEVLSVLQPDVYFKGGDYMLEQIPEAPTVQRYGGEIKIMPVWEGHSTTHSFKKIKKSEAT